MSKSTTGASGPENTAPPEHKFWTPERLARSARGIPTHAQAAEDRKVALIGLLHDLIEEDRPIVEMAEAVLALLFPDAAPAGQVKSARDHIADEIAAIEAEVVDGFKAAGR